MSCPYCLSFSREAANKANPKKKTLVQAYWEYEDDNLWVAFTPGISGLLEASYEAWLRDPSLKKAPEVQCGRMLYRVDYTFMRPDHRQHEKPTLQKMRRVGVTSADAEMCSMDKRLYEEFSQEREQLQSEIEQLKRERSGDAEQHGKQLSEMETELKSLRETCAGQLEELGRLKEDLERERSASARLREHLAGILPGRFVTLAEGAAGASPGDVGRVRAVEGPAVEVDFPGRRGLWLPRAGLRLAADAHWLTCPGSRVEWHDSESGGGTQHGVVCDSADGASVTVLCSDGRKRVHDLLALAPAESPRPPDLPLEVGDLVRAHGEAGTRALESRGLPQESVGMVVRSERDGVSVRFRAGASDSEEEEGGTVDVVFDPRDHDEPGGLGLARDEDADRVRPGVAVRLRGDCPPPAGAPFEVLQAVGVVYATHGDGTAVVDFLGALGLRCGTELLEVVEAPPTAEHAALRLLSDCLAWGQVAAQRAEEREEAALLRLMSLLPTAVAPSAGLAAPFSTAELGRHDSIFRLLSAALLGSLEGAAGVAPRLALERVEALRNPALEKVYELHLRRVQAVRPGGCAALAGVEALGVHGGEELNEFFLWHAAAPEAAEEICRDGFGLGLVGGGGREAPASGPCSSIAPVFAQNASVAELRHAQGGAGDAGGLRCLLLVRVLLGECLPVAAGLGAASPDDWPSEPGGAPYDSLCTPRVDEDCPAAGSEYAVHRLGQALPLFRVFYRHERGCRCALCVGAASAS